MRSVSALDLRNVGLMERQGFPATKFVKTLAGDSVNVIGRHMNTATVNLDDAKQKFDEATKTLLGASNELHAQMDSLSKRAKDSVGRAKDMAAQMTDAMNKVSKMVGPDFERRLEQLEQLTTCLERLAALQTAGKLEPMIEALSATRGPR